MSVEILGKTVKQKYEISIYGAKIGKAEENEITIDEKEISQLHAEIIYKNDRF